MTTGNLGVASHHTRVEQWECDHNAHWNTRFYGRSFDAAAECIVASFGEGGFYPEGPSVRHIRFHRELFALSTVEVRSALMEVDEAGGTAVVHLLSGEGKLAATALDYPLAVHGLPRVSSDSVPLAMPRGINRAKEVAQPEAGGTACSVELGPIRYGDVDHRGKLLCESLINRASIASNHQMNTVGLTPEFLRAHRMGRMAVELRITHHFSPAPGTHLRGLSRLSELKEKSFLTDHHIVTSDGDLVATLEFCLLAVNLDSRRALPVPDVVVASWSGAEAQTKS